MLAQESGACCESCGRGRKNLVKANGATRQAGAAHVSNLATVLRRFCQTKDARANQRLFKSRSVIPKVLKPITFGYLSSMQPTGVRIAWCCGGSKCEGATAVIGNCASANALR
jgi:hypothetical protein